MVTYKYSQTYCNRTHIDNVHEYASLQRIAWLTSVIQLLVVIWTLLRSFVEGVVVCIEYNLP